MSWCNLPMLVLSQILEELDVDDRLCFSAVCKSWNFAYNDHKELRPSIPLLLLPTHGKGNLPRGNLPRRILPWKRIPKTLKRDMDKDSDKARLLYDVTTRCLLEVPYGKRFCGSCYPGWLGTIDEVRGSFKELVINLINPYYKHCSPIKLPPVKCRHCLYYEYTITKLVLTSDPALHPALHPHDFTVVVCFSASTSTLAIFKTTRNCWAYIDYASPPLYTDAIVYKNSVYVVGKFNDMVSFSLNDPNWPPKINMVSPKTLVTTSDTTTLKSYLVETSKGEVLLINRFRDLEAHAYLTKTIGFKVFKITFDEETKALVNKVEVNDLEGDTLFLGTNYSTAISTSKISELLRPNSIYFTDDYSDPITMPRVGHRDIGMFCLEDQSIIEHYKFNPDRQIFATIYLEPTSSLATYYFICS